MLDRRRRVVVAAAIGWAAVIGAGAGAAPSEQDWLGVPSLGDILIAVVGVAAVIGVVLLVIMLVSVRRGGDAEAPDRKPLWPSLVIMALLLIVAFRFPRAQDQQPEIEAVPVADEQGGSSLDLRRPVIGEAEVAALLAVSAVAVAAIIWSRRQIAVVGDVAIDQETQLEPVIGRAARRLELGDDPRSAVIESYAALEQSLQQLGLGRRLSETPTEHITRVLDRSSLAAPPVLRLAGLYEVARFSDHGVSADDQREAASALGDVHRNLRARKVTG